MSMLSLQKKSKPWHKLSEKEVAMNMSIPADKVLSENTFGHEHFSPPPLAQEQEAPVMQAAGAEDEWDLLHRIRNVGEW